MRNNFKLILLFIAAVATTTLQAADKSRGCGPANYIAPKNTMISTSTRATSEFYLFPLNWSATSSGTSGCKKHEIVKNQEKSYYFIANNFEDLKKEIAQGQGDYLVNFASTLGCAFGDTPQLINTLKKNYQRILPTYETESDVFFDNVIKLLKSDRYLKSKCKNIVS